MWVTKVFVLGLLLLGYLCNSYAQDQVVVHLQTIDKNTEEPIADVELMLDIIQRSFTTNKAGVVTLLLPQSYYEIRASGLNVVGQTFTVLVQQDTTITFPLTVKMRVLEEVEIVESKINEKAKYSVAGVETLTPQQIQKVPMLAGEKDIVKSLTLLPGVQTGTEGSAQLLVRGGTADQNLYLLDQATLYHSGHLLGFLSSFNPLVISDITLYKGGFPARYGGRLSSILDAQVKDANLDSLHVEGNIGIISSKASVEIPIIRQKASLLVAGRRTYLDVFQRLFDGGEIREQESYSFYDGNIKGVYHLGNKHTLSAQYYQDQDSYFDVLDNPAVEDYYENRLTWRNQIGGVTLASTFGKQHENTLSITGSQYTLEQKEVRKNAEATNNRRVAFSSAIEEVSVKDHMNILLDERYSLAVGGQLDRYITRPATVRAQDAEQSLSANNLPIRSAYQGVLYGAGQFRGQRYEVDAGLRLSRYWVTDKAYYNLEPRINIKRTINGRDAVKLSYTRMVQPLHLLTDPGLGLPLNLWVASSREVVPQTAHQINGGYYTSFLAADYDFHLSVEGYYKQMNNIVAYRDGYSSSSFVNTTQNGLSRWEDVVLRGTGESYGLEVLLEKKTGAFTGWLAYTLSKTTHQFDQINQGNPFPSRYDRRHDLSLVGFYFLSNKWSLNASFSYATGQPVTLPTATYLGFNFNYDRGVTAGLPALSYTQGGRNSYRMKDFHRLDVGVQRKIRWKKVQGSVEFSLFNIYNRKNPYYYYADTDAAGDRDISVIKSVSLFPIIPSLSVSFSF